MKIAIYYPWIYLKSGVERTILETVKRSKHEYTIFTNHYDKKGTYPEFKSLKVIELKKIPVRRNLLSVLQAAVIIIFQKIDLASFDLLLVHSEGLGDFILFRNSKIPAVCYCHTPLRPVFDIAYKKRVFIKKNIFQKPLYFILAFIFKIIDRFLWQKYRYIFFNSLESIKRAKMGHLLNKNLKYKVLHPGIDWKNIKPTWKYKKYFLVPGRIMWTKNIKLAIEAFDIFEKQLKRNGGFKLIIAGQVDNKSKHYFSKLKSLAKINKNISFVKNPSEKKMKNLYKNCYTTLATSFNEDWGLTPIEANAYGKPVLSVNSGGFKENQVNGKTGYLVKPTSEKFSQKMIFLANNNKLTKELGKNARINAAKYDWIHFVKEIDILLEKIV